MAENIAAEILAPVVQDGVKWVGATIKRQFNYLCCFTSNIANLKLEVEELQNAAGDLQEQVERARDNVQVISREVEAWLIKSNDIKDKTNGILNEATNLESGCLKVRARFSLSRRAKKTTDGIKELRGPGSFDVISHPGPPPATTTTPLGVNTYEFESRKQIEEDIMTSLRGGDENMIGICGMGGLGKTTMAKMIMNRALEEHVFEEVVMAVVSQTVDTLKIQDEIAGSLGLDLKGVPSEAERVQELHETLTGGSEAERRKRILLVLDDVWETLELEELGIPRGSERCTILLTSRNNDVLGAMDVEKIFGMKVLSQKDAWHLFRGRAGTCVDDTRLNSLAKEVVKECRGLPIALTTVGAALKDEKNASIWKDALRQLTQSDPDIPQVIAEVYDPLKLSYDALGSKHAKSVFLLCCLFPEDANICLKYLTCFSMGLGIFGGIRNLEEARNRMRALIQMLKNRSLLLEGRNEDYVRMHGVVRDVSIFIAKKEGYIRHNDCTWSFSSLLFLIRKPVDDQFKLDDTFLEGIRELNVLSIENYSSLTSLPRTTESLRNLNTLILDSCWRLWTLSAVGKLVNLEILICRDCGLIQELPPDIKGLKRLKLLELTRCDRLQIIGPGIISSLVRLEELKMLGSFNNWGIQEGENVNAGLRELEALTNLTCLKIEIVNPAFFVEKRQLSSKLERFQISLIPALSEWEMQDRTWSEEKMQDMNEEWEGARFDKKLSVREWGAGTHFISDWVERTECLLLIGINATNVDLAKTQNIRWLTMGKCETMKNIGRITMDGATVCPFIERLILFDLPELEEILDGPISSNSFHNLKKLNLEWLPSLKQLWKSSYVPVFSNLSSVVISECPHLPNLGQLSISGVGCLPQLQYLRVSLCHMMKEVFLWDECDENKNNNELRNRHNTKSFPKLNEVELVWLPNLVNFCQGIEAIKFPLLTKMSIFGCPKFTSMVSSNENNSGATSDSHIDDDHSSHLFCQPQKMPFGSLKRLFTDQNPFCGHKIPAVSSFNGLEVLEIRWNQGRMSLFSSSIARDLVSLKKLTIRNCNELVQVIEDDEEKKGVSGGQRTFLFPNLQYLQLEYLPRLVRFCEWDCDIELSSLRQVIIVKCPMMTYFSSEQRISAIAQIQILHIKECEMMEQVFLWNEEDNRRNIDTKLAFSELTSLRLESLPRLTSLCKGIESLEFPQLTQIQVKDCPLLMDEVFSMNLFFEPDQVKMDIWNNLPFRNAEYLSLEGNAYTYSDVWEVQNMRCLTFRECSRGKKLVNMTIMHTLFPQLEVLRLVKLPELEEIWEVDGANSFQNLKELRLEFLPELKHLWPSQVVSIFNKLSCIYIYGCHKLCNLFSLPVMETDSYLLQLEELVIESCDMIEYVFFWNEGENQSNIHIPKLKVLILDSLPKLRSFGKGDTKIEFPLLDRKRISRCPLLENFVSTDWPPDDDGHNIHLFCDLDNEVEEKMELKLQGIITLGRNKIQECVEYRSLDDSTSFDFGVAESMRCLTFREFPMGTKLMNMATIATLFSCIKVLTFTDCSMEDLMNMTTIATPFPFVEVLCLVNITELEEIWDIDGPKNINELRLQSLPALKHLWQISGSPSQMNVISLFDKLSSIYIYECHRLRTLFSLPMMPSGSCLLQLETLVIGNCKRMKQVFLWNEKENRTNIHIPLVFPKLKVLQLDCLPRLMSFCDGTESFEFPLLVEMRISRCPLLQNLVHDADSTYLFCKPHKALKHLWKIRSSLYQMNVVSIFDQISSICIYGCDGLLHLFSLSMMVKGSCLLQLERLEIESCKKMEQVFLWNEKKNIHVYKFPKLKFVSLSFLPELRNICKGVEHIQCAQLYKMKIINCPLLESLVYWDKDQLPFIFNRLRSPQLQKGKGANTALQPEMLRIEEKQRKKEAGEQSNLSRKTATEDEEEGRKGEIEEEQNWKSTTEKEGRKGEIEEEQNWKTTTKGGGRKCEIEEEQN